jgi:hypothetical protein
MKHLFKNPQKKGKGYICNSQDKILIELNDIKIKNFKKLNDNNGYYFESIVPSKYNKDELKLLTEIDEDAKECLYSNYNEWFKTEDENDDIINEIYIKSVDDENITIILSNKIETRIVINEEEKDLDDFIEFINNNKRNKNLIVNCDILFLGIYINKSNIINKWAFKSINIETMDIDNDWNRKEIEEEWRYDLIAYEDEVNIKINKMQTSLENAKKIFNEIITEKNLKNWEFKIDKLKNNILSIYDNR